MLIHVKHDGNKDKVIFMLHGTGGDENDLYQIARFISPTATIIGIRGSVQEQGMLRYFKRYPDGSFDLEDLEIQTNLLYNGMKELLNHYKLDENNASILGYSNGANIAINIFKKFETKFKSAMLFHPSSVREGVEVQNQTQLKVFTTTGLRDPFISQKQFEALNNEFEEKKIEVSAIKHSSGHQLITEEIYEAKAFYDRINLEEVL